MDQNIFKSLSEKAARDSLSIRGVFRVKVTRADGSIEETVVENIVTAAGLDAIAAGVIDNTTSSFLFLAVGTQTAAASLGSVQGGLGEVSRKTPVTVTSSKEVAYMVSTWGGSADSVTSVALESAGMFNHANSGTGVMLNQVTGVAATLANSDFLNLEVQIQIGSHNL